MSRKSGPRKFGLDRGRVTGFYLTGRHEAFLAAIGANYNRRSRTAVTASVVLQILIEREAKRLKLPEPELPIADAS